MPPIPTNLRSLASSRFKGGAGGKFGVSVRGDQALIGKFTKLAGAAPVVMLDSLKRSLIVVEAEAVRLVTHGYYRPAVDTGRMRRAITHKITSFSPKVIEGVVGLNVFYAIYVHEGTIYMEERPFLVDALRNKQVQVKTILVDSWRNSLKGVV